jgi:serine/threonine protein kinase
MAPMPDRQAAQHQERIGRYRLIEEIATGGMAEVHLGSFQGAAGIEKLVAIKRIKPEHARDADYVRMFLNEARIAATLHHPNLVQTYDSGCEDGTYFLAMEYLRGQDTRRIIQALALAGREMPLDVAVAIAHGAATGLHYLHEKRDAAEQALGLVHRDVSPANIVVTHDGVVKLVDFGIAKAVRRANDTRGGTLKGKIAYMSPEQCRTERLDRRSDIFSLAIVLWELTVGRRLFDQTSDLEIMRAIDAVEVPRPSRLVPRYPPDLERIVEKGLARDREQRYRTAEQMQIDLERFAHQRQLTITPRTLSSFVRSLFGNNYRTIAALAPENGKTPVSAARGARPPQRTPSIRARKSRPREVHWTVTLSRRPAVQFSALSLFIAAGGVGGALLARRHRADSAPRPVESIVEPLPSQLQGTEPPPPTPTPTQPGPAVVQPGPAAVQPAPAAVQPAPAVSGPATRLGRDATKSPADSLRRREGGSQRLRPSRAPADGDEAAAADAPATSAPADEDR